MKWTKASEFKFDENLRYFYKIEQNGAMGLCRKEDQKLWYFIYGEWDIFESENVEMLVLDEDDTSDLDELAKEILRVVKERDKLEAEICRLEMIWETERGMNNELKKEATEQKEKQASLVIEIEQQKAVSKAWQTVAEEKEKECERWKKTTERFKAEGDKWLNKSISQSKRIEELEELIKAANISGLPIKISDK